VTPAIAEAMRQLERAYDDHWDALLVRRDVDAALNPMVAEPTLRHLPVGTGADGRHALHRFYAERFLPYLPADLAITRISRTAGRFQLVDETLVSFTHDRPLPWLLPETDPTHRRAEVTAIVIAEFDRLRIRAQRIHWDHATLRDQLGLPRCSAVAL
jgi:carboxymethylenebutenolidase